MTHERIKELEHMATEALAECSLVDRGVDHASVAFWHGVMSVVDELKAEEDTAYVSLKAVG